jgi:MFS family permease
LRDKKTACLKRFQLGCSLQEKEIWWKYCRLHLNSQAECFKTSNNFHLDPPWKDFVQMSVSHPREASPLTKVQWLICLIAAIGFAFDIYELLMLPLIARSAIEELTGFKPGSPGFQTWVGYLFFIPAFAGGFFGLIGGYLTDRLGRRFVLTWSILLYAFSAFAAGYSTNIQMLLLFRTTTFIGVCIEFVAAVAWLAELFPNPIQREKVLGYTQAFSSIGGILVALAATLAEGWSASLPMISIPGFLVGLIGQIGDGHHHESWRYTLMSGLIPAIPLLLIRPFLPESPEWAKKREAGTLRRPSFRELFSPQLRRTTIVTTIMFACSYGAAFGAIQQLQLIVPGIQEVKEATKDMKPPVKAGYQRETTNDYTKAQEVGGLCGRFVLAWLAVLIISRRKLLRVFQIPGLILMPLIFLAFAKGYNVTWISFDMSWSKVFHQVKISYLGIGIFLAGFFTVAQFSFWGNYLPRVYPMHLRGCGESFAANVGGRMIGTSFALLATTLAKVPENQVGFAPTKMAYVAASIAFGVYLVGAITCFWLPEPQEGEFGDD